MHFIELHHKLHAAYQTIAAAESAQDEREEAINDLFLFLDGRRNFLFPDLFVHEALRIFRWYLDDILPDRGYDNEDQQAIAEDYTDLCAHLHTVSQDAQHIERHIVRVIAGLRNSTFRHEREAAETLMKMLHSHFCDNRDAALRCVSTFRKKIRGAFNRQQIAAFVTRFFHTVEDEYRAVPEHFQILSNIHELCEFVFSEYFQGKAVLVNTDRQGSILPLWVSVDLGQITPHVEFDNHTIDAVMRASANTARTIAIRYLRTIYAKELKDTAAVRCQFPLPWVGYRDSSASLLLAIQIVGNVLELDPEPATVATGEIDASGTVLKVGWIAEKLTAADHDKHITRMLIPQANMHDVDLRQFRSLSVIPIRSFPEALEQYYGEALQQQLKRISRRQVLKTAMGVVAAPLLFLSTKNFSTTASVAAPVAECDYRLLECARDLYQKKSDYQSAITILDSILTRFSQDAGSAEAQQLKAFASGQLGVIHLQRHHIQESLQVLEQAATLWERIHDHEKQADIFLRMGEVYRYTVAMDGVSRNSKAGLRCYRQAHDLLKPSMPLYTRLQGRYYSLTGFMHYWMEEYEIAEQFGRKSLTIFEEPESNWTYQTARQHLGRTLINTGKYDEAHDILQSTHQAQVLQGPHDRARNALGLSELYLAVGEVEKGLHYADTVKELCEQYELHGQQRVLSKLLASYQGGL